MPWSGEGDSERSAQRRGDLGDETTRFRKVSRVKSTISAFPAQWYCKPQLTVDVPMEGHHACPLRTAKRGVMQLVGQGRGDPGLGMTLGSPAMRRVLLVSCSAVLKPHL